MKIKMLAVLLLLSAAGWGQKIVASGGTVKISGAAAAAMFDPAVPGWYEEFCGPVNSSGAFFNVAGTSASSAFVSTDSGWGHPCVVRITSNTTYFVVLKDNARYGLGAFVHQAGGAIRFEWRFPACVADTSGDCYQSTMRIGFAGDGTLFPPADGCWLRYIQGADTTLKFYCRSNGSDSSPVDLGVAPDANWHKIIITMTSTAKISVQLDSGSVLCITSASSGCAVNNAALPRDIPASIVYTAQMGIQGSTAGKNLDVDYIDFTTGLSSR